MQYSSIPLAQSIVRLCISKGITDVVISPGSRNAPLTITFSNHPTINAYSIVDERSAAFFALGMAQQQAKPVALVCTSGSALLNYYPAIAEAYYSDIPLVVISADRPAERIDIGDGQTIRQKNVYQNHILYSANLYSELADSLGLDEKIKQKSFEVSKLNEREINLALNTAIEKNGPVHINVPFYEPLYNLTDRLEVSPIEIKPITEEKEINDASLKAYSEIWSKAKRKLVLVGVNQPDSITQEYLDWLAEDPSVLVFTETTSNLHHSDFITRIDKLIAPLEQKENSDEWFKKLQPDILLTIGGHVISKKIKAFLRKYQPKHHWHIDAKKALNTYFCLDRHFEVSPNVFLNKLKQQASYPKNAVYKDFWCSQAQERDKHHDKFMESLAYSDLKVFYYLNKHFPAQQVLQLSNSSIIRYAQLFKFSPEVAIYCNRGTSGIDGSTSTAVGAAHKASLPTTFITGDLSFFYDSNALWNAYIPNNFKMIVINNQGGGIFRILPGAKEVTNFDTYLETTHQLTAEHIAKMHRIAYFKQEGEQGLEDTIQRFLNEETGQPKLLEIFTPRTENDQYLRNYFKTIFP